jgi:uncharacterized protein involved in exopolysaccharide biosynthesis
MTNEQKYAELALKLGDLTVKGWAIEEQIKAVKAQLAALDKEISDEG